MTRRIDPDTSTPSEQSGATVGIAGVLQEDAPDGMTEGNRISRRSCLFRSLACLFVTPLPLLLSSQWIALQHPWMAVQWMVTHPVAVLSTWLLLLAVLLPVFGLLGRVFPAVLLAALPTLVLSLVSFYKTVFNGTPLQLSDLALAGNFFEIAAFAAPRIRVSAITLLAIGAVVAWSVVCALQDALFRKTVGRLHSLRATRHRIPATRIHTPGVPVPLGILAGAALVIVILLFPMKTAAASAGENFQTQAERNDAYGYVWGFFVTASTSTDFQPTDLSDEQVERLIAQPTPSAAADTQIASAMQETPPVPPTLIFLMSESFFDITKLPNVQFSEDPLPNYHRLCETGTNGGFLSNTYAGGTGNVEMEMFTGISSSFIRESEALTALTPFDVYKELPSIVKALRAQGYRTVALHSHTPRLYNRTITYPSIGFEQVLFDDSFPADAETSGGYISDMALSDKMISLYEERSPTEPFFLYSMSMENHGPYPADKFSTPLEIDVSSPVLSEPDLAILRSLTHGLHNADRALGRLIDYYEKVEEPVILVFCGDHLPGLFLSETETIYTKTGYASTANTLHWEPDELAHMLTSDYVIWTNTGETLWPDRTESSMLLGMHLLKAIGVPLDGFLGWLDRNVADVMLLQRPRLFVDAQGHASTEPPDASASVIDTYRALIRHLVYGAFKK